LYRNKIVQYAEDMRKFSKDMYQKAKEKGDSYDIQYYLGRMNSAKMIRDAGLKILNREKNEK